MSEAAWRLFLAAPLPEATRAAIGEWAAQQSRVCPGWRWVRPEAMHLTLRFYGSTLPERAASLTESLRELAAGHEPVMLDAVGWGAFPSPRRPRVLWVGLAGDLGPLERLASAAEQAARDLGFEPERRPFRPHLTVARLQRRGGRASAPRDAGAPLRFGPAPVDRLVLYRSHLGPGGARHEPLADERLRPAAGEPES